MGKGAGPGKSVAFLLAAAVAVGVVLWLSSGTKPGAGRDEGAPSAPADPARHVALGDQHLERRDWSAADREYSEALRLAPSLARAWSGRGWARVSAGRLEDGEADCTKAVELDPADAAAWRRRADSRRRLGKLPEALEDFRKAAALDPADASVSDDAGEILRALGRNVEAEPEFGEAIRRDGRLVDAWIHRAVARHELGRIEEAEADFARAVELDPKNAKAWSERARARLRRGDFAKAVEDAEQAADLRPDDAPVARAYARAHAGRAAEALEDFRRIAGAHDPAWLWIWLLRTRAGEEGPATLELQNTLRIRMKSDWFSTIANFLTGSMTEESFLKAAESGDTKEVREQDCEANYYAGMKRLFAGDKARAADFFRESVESGLVDLPEHAASRVELQRLGLR